MQPVHDDTASMAVSSQSGAGGLVALRPHTLPAQLFALFGVSAGASERDPGYVRVTVAPRFNWGRTKPTVTRGSSHVRYVGDDLTLRMTTDAPLAYVLSNTPFLVTRGYNFILGPDETLTHGVEDIARDFELRFEHACRGCF